MNWNGLPKDFLIPDLITRRGEETSKICLGAHNSPIKFCALDQNLKGRQKRAMVSMGGLGLALYEASNFGEQISLKTLTSTPLYSGLMKLVYLFLMYCPSSNSSCIPNCGNNNTDLNGAGIRNLVIHNLLESQAWWHLLQQGHDNNGRNQEMNSFSGAYNHFVGCNWKWAWDCSLGVEYHLPLCHLFPQWPSSTVLFPPLSSMAALNCPPSLSLAYYLPLRQLEMKTEMRMECWQFPLLTLLCPKDTWK